jgi:hypothetical protein
MVLKSNKIKNMNDLIGGLVLIAGSIWLLVSKSITVGTITTGQGGLFVRADVYIRMLGVLMLFLAVLMVLRSINFKKEAETKAFFFNVTKESLLSFAALILFIVILKPVGFAISTYALTFFLVVLYTLKEYALKNLTPRQKKKKIVFAAVFSLILVVFVWAVFEKVLLVTLPPGFLFR